MLNLQDQSKQNDSLRKLLFENNSENQHVLTDKQDIEELIKNKKCLKNKTKHCNQAIKDFLVYSLKKTNKDYFPYLVKAIILYRECINKGEEHDVTSTKYSDELPQYTNAFFNFMADNDYFMFNDDDSKYELIEIIMYFCRWLKVNSYTRYKLRINV
jgi:hypothetical protein